MRVQLTTAAALARLMHDTRTREPDLAWLLHGPTDEEVVRAAAEAEPPRAWLLAAE